MKYLVTIDGADHSVDVQPGARPGSFRVTVGDTVREVDLASAVDGWLWSLVVDGRSFQVSRGEGQLQVDGRAFAVDVERDLGLQRGPHGMAGGPATVTAPIPGLVVAVPVQPGDSVHEGQSLVVVEAMKMQMELKSPRSGRVIEVQVEAGQEVNLGQVLAVVGD